MKPRSRLDHAPAPYAVGEDVATSTARVTATGAARARPRRRVRGPRGARLAQMTSTPEEFTAGADVGLAPTEARLRRRRPNRLRVALATLTHHTVTGARRAGRQLRRSSPGQTFRVGAPVALLLALLIWMLTGAYWQTRRILIQGTSDPALLALAHTQRLTGCNAFRCDFSAARRAIAASPRAQLVSIQVVFPDTTLVRITPRQAAALWRTQGQTWAVGADGVVVGATQGDPSLATPGAAVVDDPADLAFAGTTPRPGAHMDAALVEMARQLRISGADAGMNPLSLSYSATDGFAMLTNGSGTLVVFGSPDDAQATLANLNSASPAPAINPAINPPTPAEQSTQPIQAIQATPAQAAQGAKVQVEVAGAILAQLSQSGASATLIDVRWGSHPYYR